MYIQSLKSSIVTTLYSIDGEIAVDQPSLTPGNHLSPLSRSRSPTIRRELEKEGLHSHNVYICRPLTFVAHFLPYIYIARIFRRIAAFCESFSANFVCMRGSTGTRSG